MPPSRKWTRLEELAVLHLYRGKVHPESREAVALADALERSPKSIGARMVAMAGLDTSNPKQPASKATALTQSLWAEYQGRPHRHSHRRTACLHRHPQPLRHGPTVKR